MDICRCLHQLSPKNNSFNCLNCGAYMFRHRSVQGVKTKRFADSNMLAPRDYHAFLKKEAQKFQTLPEVRISGETRGTIERLLEKFHIHDDSFALGLYIFYTLFMKDVTTIQEQTKLATLSLYEACKTLESNKGISLRRFWKYSNNCFEKEQYPEIESNILIQMDFNLEKVTFMSFLHFYLVNGAVFSNEASITPKKVEDRILRISHWFISTGIFMLLAPEQLACYILYKSRKDSNVVEVWNWYIEQYTGVNVATINSYVKQIETLMVHCTTDQGREMEQLCQALSAQNL